MDHPVHHDRQGCLCLRPAVTTVTRTGEREGVRVVIDPVVIDKRPRSLVHMFLRRAEESSAQDAFYYPVEGGWQESSWLDTSELVDGLAAGLLALGLEPEERVALVARPRYEWVLGQLATLRAGGAVTAVEPDAGDAVIADVLADSGARVVIAEDYDVVRGLWRIRGRIKDVVKVVQIDGDYPDGRVVTLESLLAAGREHLLREPRALAQRLYAVRRDGLAALLYAPEPGSGAWRGVRVSHAALTYQATAVAALGLLTDQDLAYLALPLSTAYAQAVLAVQLACGFPLALEGRPGQALVSPATVRPSVLAATPAMLRRLREDVEGAQGRGLLRSRRTQEKRVRAEVRARLGDRLRLVVCAGGALESDLAGFFESYGVPVVEVYGRAETGGAVSVGRPGEQERTAGRPLPGTEVRISPDGEIEVAGPGVTDGYHRRPADTARVLRQGWLRTGDAGALDGEGRLLVLGRLPAHGADGRDKADPADEARPEGP